VLREELIGCRALVADAVCARYGALGVMCSDCVAAHPSATWWSSLHIKNSGAKGLKKTQLLRAGHLMFPAVASPAAGHMVLIRCTLWLWLLMTRRQIARLSRRMPDADNNDIYLMASASFTISVLLFRCGLLER
jgi:hypothetical protein